jgi:hypothetical protein
MSRTMKPSTHTPGPWIACNMVHAERGDAMTPEEIGEYVKNSVTRSISDGGASDRFLFISTEGDDVPDICHVGNGPTGPANARLIAAAPDLLEALLGVVHTLDVHGHVDSGTNLHERARAAISKAAV